MAATPIHGTTARADGSGHLRSNVLDRHARVALRHHEQRPDTQVVDSSTATTGRSRTDNLPQGVFSLFAAKRSAAAGQLSRGAPEELLLQLYSTSPSVKATRRTATPAMPSSAMPACVARCLCRFQTSRSAVPGICGSYLTRWTEDEVETGRQDGQDLVETSQLRSSISRSLIRSLAVQAIQEAERIICTAPTRLAQTLEGAGHETFGAQIREIGRGGIGLQPARVMTQIHEALRIVCQQGVHESRAASEIAPRRLRFNKVFERSSSASGAGRNASICPASTSSRSSVSQRVLATGIRSIRGSAPGASISTNSTAPGSDSLKRVGSWAPEYQARGPNRKVPCQSPRAQVVKTLGEHPACINQVRGLSIGGHRKVDDAPVCNGNPDPLSRLPRPAASVLDRPFRDGGCSGQG